MLLERHGYLTSKNDGNILQLSEAALQALASALKVMADSGLPFATSAENGIPAEAVVEGGTSACRSPRRKALRAEISASVNALPRPFEVSGWKLENDLPVKAGDLVRVRGGIVGEGESPTIRMVTNSRGMVKNCRPTNRFSHFDATGRARYYEECEHIGTREVVIIVKVKALRPLLAANVTLKTGDYVSVVARLSTVARAVTQSRGLTTTTHSIQVEPVVVLEVSRDHKAEQRF